MLRLHELIKELLQKHECVIVPDFGGFILNPDAARYDQLQHKFYPPSKKVSFNRNLIKNDGLLAQAVSSKNAVSYTEALGFIQEAKQKWQETLEKEGSLHLAGLGIFQISQVGILSFEPNAQESYGADAFGLEPFHALPLAATAVAKPTPSLKEPEVAAVSTAPTQEKPTSSKPKRAWLGYAAAGAVALPILGYAAWLASSSAVFNTQQQFHYSDLNPFSEKVCEVYSPNSSSFEFIAIEEAIPFSLPKLDDMKSPTAEVKFIEDEEGAVIVNLLDEAEAVRTIKEEPTTLVEETIVAQQYHIIAGCFGVEANATKLVAELKAKGFSAAKILDKDGRLFRVTAGGFNNLNNANIALRDFKVTENSNAWVTKK